MAFDAVAALDSGRTFAPDTSIHPVDGCRGDGSHTSPASTRYIKSYSRYAPPGCVHDTSSVVGVVVFHEPEIAPGAFGPTADEADTGAADTGTDSAATAASAASDLAQPRS